MTCKTFFNSFWSIYMPDRTKWLTLKIDEHRALAYVTKFIEDASMQLSSDKGSMSRRMAVNFAKPARAA